MVVKTKGQVVAQPVDKAIKTEIEWLIDRHDGAPNFELRKFRIKPGGTIPKHYHPDIEHEQYVLAGDYEVGIGDEVHRLKAGDSLFIPAGTIHWYSNSGKEDAEFLCIVPKKEKYSAIYLDELAATRRKDARRPSIAATRRSVGKKEKAVQQKKRSREERLTGRDRLHRLVVHDCPGGGAIDSHARRLLGFVLNAAIISPQNAGRSSGTLEVIRLPSLTTALST